MKKNTPFIILIISYLITSCGTTQTIKIADLTSEKVYENLEKSKTDLYLISNDWMIDTFKNADNVIQFTDKEEGTIIGKYYLYGNLQTIYGSVIDNRIYAKIAIQLQDNRAKITISPTTDLTIYNKYTLQEIRRQISDLTINFTDRITDKNSKVW